MMECYTINAVCVLRFKLAIDTMSKTEIFLLLIILLILGSALWFIFSESEAASIHICMINKIRQ
jgi:Na+/melibiose symporter-like transporter